jgi:hypothetical protein
MGTPTATVVRAVTPVAIVAALGSMPPKVVSDLAHFSFGARKHRAVIRTLLNFVR